MKVPPTDLLLAPPAEGGADGAGAAGGGSLVGLGPDVVRLVAAWLDIDSLCALSSTSSGLRLLCSDATLWQELFARRHYHLVSRRGFVDIDDFMPRAPPPSLPVARLHGRRRQQATAAAGSSAASAAADPDNNAPPLAAVAPAAATAAAAAAAAAVVSKGPHAPVAVETSHVDVARSYCCQRHACLALREGERRRSRAADGSDTLRSQARSGAKVGDVVMIGGACCRLVSVACTKGGVH